MQDTPEPVSTHAVSNDPSARHDLTAPDQAQPAAICGPEGEPHAIAQGLTLNTLGEAAPRHDPQLDRLVYGAHVCVLYATAGEFVRSLVPFVLESLRRREQCLYLADATNVSE